jgi:DNA mismatch repair protein MutH
VAGRIVLVEERTLRGDNRELVEVVVLALLAATASCGEILNQHPLRAVEGKQKESKGRNTPGTPLLESSALRFAI